MATNEWNPRIHLINDVQNLYEENGCLYINKNVLKVTKKT